jgi:hypothetical protein
LTQQAIWKSTGIINSGDLYISQNGVGNMSVNISAGWAAILGTYQTNMGVYMAYNDATVNATITTANGSNPRIDLICLTVADAYYSGASNTVTVNVVAGTPAASPAVPATPTNSIALGQVYVGTSVTSILTANITNYNTLATSATNNNVMQAGKNAIINGGMDIWQRGTSIAIAASVAIYTADRFQVNTGANQASTISRQVTGDTTNLPNIQYALRYQRNSGQTGTTAMSLSQSLETVNSIPLAGKQVTLSYYARAGANYSAASNALVVNLFSGTGTDQNRGNSPYTGDANPAGATATLTTTWQRFSVTGTVASTATELGLYITFTPTGTAGANDYFDITGVQLELGSTATTFSRAGGSIGGELALCQRYYYRINAGGAIAGTGTASSTTSAYGVIPLPVQMRVTPTALDYSLVSLYDGVTTTNGTTAALFAGASAYQGAVSVGVAAGLTQFRPYFISTQGGGYYGFSAEL